MAFQKPSKKPYVIISDFRKRTEIVEFALEDGTQAALDRYGISIATLKRWRANYNSTDPKRSLMRKYPQKTRIEKYEKQCVKIKCFLKEYYSLYGNKRMNRMYRKKYAIFLKEIQNSIYPIPHRCTVYRLVNDVKTHFHSIPSEYLGESL